MSDPALNAGSAANDKQTATRTVTIRSDRLTVAELLADRRLLRIEHNDEEYVLRLTKNNKLILTK